MYLEQLKGEEVIVKERFVKEYRHPDLDKKLAKRRINAEVKALERAKVLGVNAPAVKFSDVEGRTIKMEYLKDHEASKYFLQRAISDPAKHDDGNISLTQPRGSWSTQANVSRSCILVPSFTET